MAKKKGNTALAKWRAAAKAEGYMVKGAYKPLPKKGTAAYKRILKRYNGTAGPKTEIQKARAKFNKESHDKKADLKQTAKIAKTVKAYHPRKNDFKGVDTKKKAPVKRKAAKKK